MNYKGAYAAGTSYSVGDAVVFTDNLPYYLQNPAVAGTIPHDKRYWARVERPMADVIMMFHSMLTTINAYIADDPGSEDKISAMIAPVYTKKTYSAGDHVTHDGKYYVCNANIGTAEDWTAAHWTEKTVGGEIKETKAAIPTNIDDEGIVLTSGDHDYLVSVDATGETPEVVAELITAET